VERGKNEKDQRSNPRAEIQSGKRRRQGERKMIRSYNLKKGQRTEEMETAAG